MYRYEDFKDNIDLDCYVAIRDCAKRLLRTAGAFDIKSVLSLNNNKLSCVDSYKALACIDRLEEKGEIKKVYKGITTQYDIYTDGE